MTNHDTARPLAIAKKWPAGTQVRHTTTGAYGIVSGHRFHHGSEWVRVSWLDGRATDLAADLLLAVGS